MLMAFLSSSCWQYQAVEIVSQSEQVAGTDTLFNHLITPYKAQMEVEMSKEIGQLSNDLQKAKPEGSLGNFICNILLETSSNHFSGAADFSVYNYGGLRKDYLAAGTITKGEIFELLPFDNTAVLLTLDGNSTSRLLDKIAMEGGWPVAGITMTIENGQAHNVLVRGLPFDNSRSYSVVMNDYMANGGDGMDFLRSVPAENSGVTVRDLVLAYLEEQTRNQIIISVQKDNRIVVGE
jgi:2',3'-cyclic-nucleotide 2'-phosphodiesterase (5'-nucleotidase family)